MAVSDGIVFASLEKPYPGCLLASYTYELQLFDDQTRRIINNVFLTWRDELTKRFKIIAKKSPLKQSVHLPSLADQCIVLIEGAFILSKSLDDTHIVVEQLQHYKNYLESIFQQK